MPMYMFQGKVRRTALEQELAYARSWGKKEARSLRTLLGESMQYLTSCNVQVSEWPTYVHVCL